LNKQIVFVDVDDTLVRSVGTKRIPMPRVIERVKALHLEGAELYLWSTGGAEYARTTATELGLLDCFAAFLPKPNLIIDDQAVSDWRYCRHQLPMSV
jgi:FMN phosphatase YigB (HAD superfamily)